jgi:uncharacterized protein (TIGR03437 family)
MNCAGHFRAVIFRMGFWLAAVALGLLLIPGLVAPVCAGTFGRVVPIVGEASDIALDEPRGVLYIANFTANRIDVMSLQDYSIRKSLHVAPNPGSLALSPDGNYLVITHFGNYTAPTSSSNALSVISLNADNAIQTFALDTPPLGVAFGYDGFALVVTTTNFILFDPASGQTTVVDTIAGVTAKTLPVPPANFPPNIVAASLNVSADNFHVYGLTDTIRFHYNVLTHEIISLGYTSSPPMGPRVVSVSRDGAFYTAGWALFNSSGLLVAQFANSLGLLNVGSHAIDSSAGLIYAQIPEGTAKSAVPPTNPATPPAPQAGSVAPPVLQIVDADNLTVRQKLRLPENLGGKALLSSKGDLLYTVSDSGVMVLPVGYLNSAHRVQASQPDMVFRSNFCDRSMVTQKITILDPGGNHTDFSLSASLPGIVVSPTTGTTPATVHVTVDPNIFQNEKGTVAGLINIQSAAAVNVPDPIRVLINNREPEQRGTFVNVPGTLVDVKADPVRHRFYILRQDKNQVLVYDSTGQNRIAVMRTSNTPTSMAITMDHKYLIVGHDNSQLAYVYDLDKLRPVAPIVMPFGHYPRSVAVSTRAILVACRVAGSTHVIDAVDFPSRTATPPPTLGIFQNDINIDTVLTSSPDGRTILAASADGTTMVYDASADTFVSARKDFTTLSGAFAASNYRQYIVDNNLLNASLVPIRKLDATVGNSSGFAFVDHNGFRTTAIAVQATAGVIQRVQTSSGDGIRPTDIVEAPLTSNLISSFTRTLAPLADHSAIVSLTTSGFTMLPWNFDAAVAPPQLNKIVNAADFTQPVAPGGLVSLFGTQLSTTSQSASALPLPTLLADSCLSMNGTPIPMMYVSGSQINGQLPFSASGDATLVLRTPGGISQGLSVTIQPNAPSVFRGGTAGPTTGIPTVMRSANNTLVTPSNPIHQGDEIIIYATGLGAVSPPVPDGTAGPASPLAVTIAAPTVSIGGANLRVDYSGLAPEMVGVYQINAKAVSKLPAGLSVPLMISQGGGTTTMPVRVVK